MLARHLSLSLSLAACAGARPASLPRSPIEASSPPRAVRGTVRYEARHPTERGISSAVELRAARHVTLVALGLDARPLAECATDMHGAFACAVPEATRHLIVQARARVGGNEVSCSAAADLATPHAVVVPLPDAGDAVIDVVVDDRGRESVGGAFHIVDTVLRGFEAVHAWTGRTLPSLTVYWGREVTTEWSYYRGERPAGSGRYVLELLGGSRDRYTTTDTDEHDEAIILHEFGHFVMDLLSTNSSTGGMHPSNTLIDPGLAWEEGRATWFAAAVRASPRYEDTIGVEPRGELRVNHDLEHSDGPRGNGAENSVSDVLWDLTDGFEGYADRDNDGVALGPAVLLRAMIEMNRIPGAYPCLSSFLEYLTTSSSLEGAEVHEALLSPQALASMLSATHEPDTLLVRSADARWPQDLTAPAIVRDKIDGLTQPAPSGGPRRPENGLDALRVYRVQLTARAWLAVELLVQGSGDPRDHTDLDVELRDHRGEVITAARGRASRETLSRLLQPGWYMIYVRDGGTGNRANFELRVRLRPV